MAGVIDKLRKKNKDEAGWSRSGTFMNKPTRGWLHPDSQLEPEAGVCYGVRYVGNMEVKTSMRTLDFETRTLVAKESINRVCEAAGFKTVTKKRKNDKKLNKLLGDFPGMQHAGANVNLTVTTDSLNLMVMESGEIIADHEMPGISFASGGDPDTMDYVAYIAKDPVNGRACHVLECGGGLAQDVITTIGQAFELRFKQYLQKQPKTVQIPEKFENQAFADSWGNEPEYYNDRPDAMPPLPNGAYALPPEYSESDADNQINGALYSSVKDQHLNYPSKDGNLLHLGEEHGAVGGMTYDNSNGISDSPFDDFIYDNKKSLSPKIKEETNSDKSESLDAFNMVPFSDSLPTHPVSDSPSPAKTEDDGKSPFHEEWFHGKLTRHQAEDLLQKDGDFLVRESTNSPGQYVLSGRLNDRTRHLLLVDPEGVVRTMDRTFDSVTHLVTFHLDNSLPIVSQDSELILKFPVINSNC